MLYFDRHPDVIKWTSEEVIVPYRRPDTGRIHRYFPDFVVKIKDKESKIRTLMVEVKPASQISPPQNPSRKNYLKEAKEWQKNQAKWEAARAYCEKRGWTFVLKDEFDLGIKPRNK